MTELEEIRDLLKELVELLKPISHLANEQLGREKDQRIRDIERHSR